MATADGRRELTDHKYVSVAWGGLANGDDGTGALFAGVADKTVQVLGTFGSGGTVVIEGSMDGSTWAGLTDPQGDPLSFAAAGINTVLENPKFIRPNVTAGDGTTDLTVIIGGSIR